MNVRRSRQNHRRTTRDAIIRGGGLGEKRERQCHARTCDQTIDDGVQIDFRVSHKNSPEQDRFGNRVRVLLRSGAASVVENPQSEIDRGRKEEDEGSAEWREKGNIDPMEVPTRVFVRGVVPLPLA